MSKMNLHPASAGLLTNSSKSDGTNTPRFRNFLLIHLLLSWVR
jgi:hypothetical protein